MLRRLALTAVVSLAVLSAAAPLATAVGPLPVPLEGTGPLPVSEEAGPVVSTGAAGSPYSGMRRPARKGGPVEARGPRDTDVPTLPGRSDPREDADGPSTLPAYAPAPADADAPTRLTVTVEDSGNTATTASTGNRVTDGSYELTCTPATGTRSGTRAGGSHPDAQAACDRLAEAEGAGEDLFRPVAEDAMCTQVYGGPAAARITGTWRGRPVDAYVNRKNGCEIARWNALRPLLPTAGQ